MEGNMGVSDGDQQRRDRPLRWGTAGPLSSAGATAGTLAKAGESTSAPTLDRVSTTRYLRPRVRPLVPAAKALGETLRSSEVLRQLSSQASQGQARLELVKLAIPRPLQASVLAGGVDEQGWTLLVRNAAAAAKLRMLKPHLQLLLQERFGPGELRIKLLSSP
jgi:hypothetical protein